MVFRKKVQPKVNLLMFNQIKMKKKKKKKSLENKTMVDHSITSRNENKVWPAWQ